MRRIGVRVGAIMLVAIATACTREPLQGPGEVDFAKGGTPGKPADEGVTLLEYWIQDVNLIHIKGQGDVDVVNLNVVHDYFFNGIRDDDYSPHYEYTHVGPPPVPLQFDPDGTFHVDVPWNGERRGTDDFYPDFLVTDVGGADPFTFDMYFGKDGEPVAGIQPQGVILAGQNQGPEAALAGDDGTEIQVSSYALYSGTNASGSIWIQELSLEDISCSLRKRRGESVRQLTGSVHAALGSDQASPSAWLEFHLVVDGAITGGKSYITVGGVADFIISEVVPGADEAAAVELQVDYVYATGESVDLVYDPTQNQVDTRNGDAAITTIGDPVPIAATGTEVVPCGH